MGKRSTQRVQLQLWSLDERVVPNTTPTVPTNVGNLNASALQSLAANAGVDPQSLQAATNTAATPSAQAAAPQASPPVAPSPPPPPAFASFLPDRTARPQVQIISSTGTSTGTMTVFNANYTRGVWAARADVTGDGRPDVIAASGVGLAPTVAVFDALDNRLIRAFTPYEPTFTGGVVVATADLDGDGRAEIITGTEAGGGPRVKVYSGLDNSLIADFMGIEDTEFRGGVRVALGDVNGDGTPDLIAAAGAGGGPRVAIFDGKSVLAGSPARLIADFFVFENTLRDGVFPSAGKLDADSKVDLLFGAGPGGSPRVLGISSARLLSDGPAAAINAPLTNFFAGLGDSRGGVRVGIMPLASGLSDIITVDGTGGLAQRYNASGKLQGTIDRELALGGGLLSDGSGQVLSLGKATTTTPGTGSTTTNTNAALQSLLNSLTQGNLLGTDN